MNLSQGEQKVGFVRTTGSKRWPATVVIFLRTASRCLKFDWTSDKSRFARSAKSSVEFERLALMLGILGGFKWTLKLSLSSSLMLFSIREAAALFCQRPGQVLASGQCK